MGTCMRIGCCAEARVAVRLVVPDALSDETSAEGMLKVNLCLYHFERATAAEFLSASPEIVALMEQVAAPGTEPEMADAYLEPIFIGGAEWKAWRSLEAVLH